jgi:hypothetical protein
VEVKESMMLSNVATEPTLQPSDGQFSVEKNVAVDSAKRIAAAHEHEEMEQP